MFRSPFHGSHREILDRAPRVGDMSPWGEIQHATPRIHGVTHVSTAGHGGFHVSLERLGLMPKSMRSTNNWYEEDCEVALVLYCFFDEFVAIKHLNPSITRDYLAREIRNTLKVEM